MAFASTLSGCSPAFLSDLARPIDVPAQMISEGCRATLASVRQTVLAAGVADAEATLVAGFPIFRVNRLLARLGEKIQPGTDSKAFSAWADALLFLDEEATRHEIANLPAQHYRQLVQRIFGRRVHRRQILERWRECSRIASSILLGDQRTRQRLIEAAKVPGSYSEAARFAGLFPVASIPVAAGWEQWKAENLPTFQKSPSELPLSGRLITFSPPSSTQVLRARDVRNIVQHSRGKWLGIPQPKGRDLQRLFAAFAPVWTLDVAGPFDLPGHPDWAHDGAAVVDITKPTVFTRISHTIIGNRVLLQLNYAVWFQERPRKNAIDLLGGPLDGIIWRVTLGDDGKPIAYDSIHACGCYHLVFPVRAPKQLAPIQKRERLQERPAILPIAPVVGAGKRIELRVASRTHYLQSIGIRNATGDQRSRRHYSLMSDDELRSLPLASGERRSLFGPDGLVSGTDRLERFLLWPTGVLSPGAMRQWGHHAIAFADKRHFDDPDLFAIILGW